MLTRGTSESQETHTVEAVPWLVDVVGLLWPGGEIRPVLVLPWVRTMAGDVEFVALPRRARPSLLVPAHPARVTAAALLGTKTGAPARTRRLLRLAAVGARLGAVRVLPCRLRISPPPGMDASFVGWVARALGQRPLVAIVNSPPRANRKPVVQLLSPTGETMGYAKIGMNDLTRRLVIAEGEALARLGALLIPGVRVPQLTLSGQWNGSEVIVQDVLVPDGDQAWTADELSRRFHAFAVAAGTSTAPLATSPYVVRLSERLDALELTPSTVALRLALARLVTVGDEIPLTLGQWHGDWTPWNMARSGDDLLLWDLERAEWGVPLGFDALHFEFQTAVVRGGRAALDAAGDLLARAAGILAAHSPTPATAQATARLYLLELGARYLADGQREAGGALSALEGWLLPALTDNPTASEALP